LVDHDDEGRAARERGCFQALIPKSLQVEFSSEARGQHSRCRSTTLRRASPPPSARPRFVKFRLEFSPSAFPNGYPPIILLYVPRC
jgi:hypothetical protein